MSKKIMIFIASLALIATLVTIKSCTRKNDVCTTCEPRESDETVNIKLDNSLGGYNLLSRVWKAEDVKIGYEYCDVIPVRNFPFDSLENRINSFINHISLNEEKVVGYLFFKAGSIFTSNLVASSDIKGIGIYYLIKDKMYFSLYKLEEGNPSGFVEVKELNAEVDGISFKEVHSIAKSIVLINGKSSTLFIPNYIDFDKIISNSKDELSFKLKTVIDKKNRAGSNPIIQPNSVFASG